MARQASIGEWYCPRCGGTGRPVGPTHEDWCLLCGGRGTVKWDPDKQQSGEINPLAEGQGSPWVVGLLAFAPFLVVTVATVAACRQARTGRGMPTLAWTLGRATAVVVGLATAITLAAVATGADLTPPGEGDSYVGVSSDLPEGFTGPVLLTDTWWALAFVTGVVVVWAWWSQWRLGKRAARRARET